MPKSLSFTVPKQLEKHTGAAICRLCYLYPALEFHVEGGALVVNGNDNDGFQERDLFYALYREKLAEQSVSAKSRLIDALTSA